MTGERTNLPTGLTAGVQEAFASLPPHPTSEQVSQVLMAGVSRDLVGHTIADIKKLDNCFMPSGPGGFYRSDVARGGAGRLKMHIFPSAEVCEGDTGPHSHSTDVISLVHTGAIRNTTYDFMLHEDGNVVAEIFRGPAHKSRDVTHIGTGNLAILGSEEVEGGVYIVRHGEIHTSATVGSVAVTLCYFGQPKSPGTRYEPRGIQSAVMPQRSMHFRPKDIL